MKAEILRLLRESGAYVSGQQLCEHFQASQDCSLESNRNS